MGYVHIQVEIGQVPKRALPCGDVVLTERTHSWTSIIVADGIGSGVRANVAAVMTASRLMEMLRRRFSLRDAFHRIVQTMDAWRDPSLPYTCFTVARILNDGEATILSYEMPGAILLGAGPAAELPRRTFTLGPSVIGEAHCRLVGGEGLLLLSDGVTQAGLGNGLREGWGVDGVCDHVHTLLCERVEPMSLPRRIIEQAGRLWGKKTGDDCTAVLAIARPGSVVNIFTGPPATKTHDTTVARRFLAREGWKVICGATTAKIVAEQAGKPLRMEQTPTSILAPPKYEMAGIDVVTEGAVTLNQVYNVIDEDPANHEEHSGVTQLCALLAAADRVNFLVGTAANPANEHIAFRQQGILSRARIVPLLVQRLREQGKLVVVEYV